ncbi:MAG: rhamnosyltransferase WsaF family glycosyltransferase [Solirubrobacterales bacterium]
MISVVIPVLNGAEFLDEVLTAVTGQLIDEKFEVLVIDSGSTDGSLEIVAAHPGVRLIEIDKSEFGHGRTRNLGVQNTSGELIAFLTQDATPASEHWLSAYRDAFRLADNMGAAFGPHLPRPGVSPIMARLLRDHFAQFGGEDGQPVIQEPGGPIYLSNSNSCISRAAWEQTPFRDIAYAEDQAFGVDVFRNGWVKAYVPGAAALHSHDYGMAESFKRYFDEYRGLNDSVGERTEASASKAFDIIASSVAEDQKYLEELGQPAWRRAAWGTRSAVYHTGRVGFGGLGARANKLPARVREALSFEGRGDGISVEIPPSGRLPYEDVLEVEREGVVPLVPGDGLGRPMHVAWVAPPFGIGGGGHTTIFRMVRALEQAGHRCSIWVHDPLGVDGSAAGTMRKRISDHYFRIDAPVHAGFADWQGADVAVATGWDTVYKVVRLERCGARAYFVQDHEPEFYANSSKALFAEQSYKFGLHCICASPWLADIVRERYGATATPFKLGVDVEEYSPLGWPRRTDTIAFYARTFTERRAVELGLLALEEVQRQRPYTRIALYGTHAMVHVPFTYEHIGVVSPPRLQRLYSEATVGLSLSLTNYSLIPQEMMACGLPVVELAGRACEGVFGDDGRVISLAQPEPVDIAEHILALLDDPARAAAQSDAGLAFAREHTWDVATATVVEAITKLHQAAAPPAPWRAGSLI